MAKPSVFWGLSVFVFLLVLGLVIYLVISEVAKNSQASQPPYPPRRHHRGKKFPPPPHHPSRYPYNRRHTIGGCLGTRYCCCPVTSVSKIDPVGSNCFSS